MNNPNYPPTPIRLKPDFSQGEACEWCWKFVTPGFLWRPRKQRTNHVSGRGEIHFCDEECQNNYFTEGGVSQYEAGLIQGSNAGAAPGSE